MLLYSIKGKYFDSVQTSGDTNTLWGGNHTHIVVVWDVTQFLHRSGDCNVVAVLSAVPLEMLFHLFMVFAGQI